MAGPSHASSLPGATAPAPVIAATVASMTPPASPRQPACAAATRSPDIGRQQDGQAIRRENCAHASAASGQGGVRGDRCVGGGRGIKGGRVEIGDPGPMHLAEPHEARPAIRRLRPGAGDSRRRPPPHRPRDRPGSERHRGRRSLRRSAMCRVLVRREAPASRPRPRPLLTLHPRARPRANARNRPAPGRAKSGSCRSADVRNPGSRRAAPGA